MLRLIKLALAIVGFLFLVFLARMASAQTYYSSCSGSRYTSECLTGVVPSQSAKIIIADPTITDEVAYRKWVKGCIIGERTDELGAKYYVYRDPLCAHGVVPQR